MEQDLRGFNQLCILQAVKASKPLIEAPRWLIFQPLNAMHENLLLSIRWSSP